MIILSVLLLGAASRAPSGALSPLLRTHAWLNGMPDARTLANKVILVDVFTFDCINCKHVVPELQHLTALHSADLVILGVHSPETPYERQRANVIENLAVQGITWPVAIDNDFALWNKYGIQYWPTQLIFDRRGHVRARIVGEGHDSEVAAIVERLERER